MTTGQLVLTWQKTADTLAAYGAVESAAALRQCAQELEAALLQDAIAEVTLEQAARLSGFTADALGRMLREGRLKNYGRKHAPRIRVAELPRKPHPETGAPAPTDAPLPPGTRRIIAGRIRRGA